MVAGAALSKAISELLACKPKHDGHELAVFKLLDRRLARSFLAAAGMWVLLTLRTPFNGLYVKSREMPRIDSSAAASFVWLKIRSAVPSPAR